MARTFLTNLPFVHLIATFLAAEDFLGSGAAVSGTSITIFILIVGDE
jgi:hypothetical protein